MVEKLKDFRIIALLVIYVAAFLEFMKAETAGAVGQSTLVQTAQAVTMWSAKVFFIIPAAVIVIAIVADKYVAPKISFLIGSLVGIAFTVFVFFDLKSLQSRTVGAADSSLAVHPGIGFWAIVGIFAFVIIWTLIKDFAISKESIKEKGIQGTFNDIVSQVDSESTLPVFSSTNDKNICPSCGAALSGDDMFCGVCGAKVEVKASSVASKAKTQKRMTVSEYIRSIKNYSCEHCGELITGNDRFCPNCGKEIIIKVNPSVCAKCGNKLDSGFSFCPKCSSKVDPVVLQTNCKKCGADLLFGKDFCPNCGTSVDYSGYDEQ